MQVKGFSVGILGSIVEPILPLLKPFIKGLITNMLLDPLRAKNKEVHDLVITTLYGPVDVIAEDAAEKTATQVDDFGVEVIKEVLEEAAEASGITLPNLDED